MKVSTLQRISPTHHHTNNVAEILRIYVRKSFKPQMLRTRQTEVSGEETSGMENISSKNIILRRIRQAKLETTVKEKRLQQLRREESDLAKQIKLLKKKLKNKHSSFHSSAAVSKPTTAPDVQHRSHVLLPRRQEFKKQENQSLYERERQQHFESLRRSESLVKCVLAEQKRIGLYSREVQRTKFNEQKAKSEQNQQLYRALVRIKQVKLREQQLLRYQELSMQARFQSELLENQEKEELARVSKLQKMKENIEIQLRP